MAVFRVNTLPQHVLRGLHRGSGISALQMLIFASARPTRIASIPRVKRERDLFLCLSTSYADCIVRDLRLKYKAETLPQHVLRGLHRQKRTR